MVFIDYLKNEGLLSLCDGFYRLSKNTWFYCCCVMVFIDYPRIRGSAVVE